MRERERRHEREKAGGGERRQEGERDKAGGERGEKTGGEKT